MSQRPNESDVVLLDRFRGGDDSAFDELLRRHRPYLRRLIEMRLDGRLSSRVDPSDLIQEAHLEAFRRIERYLDDPPMPFRLWLRQIACDRVGMAERRHLRTQKRDRCRELPLPERSSILLARQLFGTGDMPDEELAKREEVQLVREAVAALSETDREVLTLRTFEGLAFDEIALLLKIEPSAVRKRHGRALLRLHRRLEDLSSENSG